MPAAREPRIGGLHLSTAPCRAPDMARRPRQPNAEERALWKANVRDATPLRHAPARRPPPAPAVPPAVPPASALLPAPLREPLPEFRIGARAPTAAAPHDRLPSLPERLASAPVAMDRRRFDRLRRGKLTPEAKIDLHGMTLAAAHPALIGFVLASWAEGRRLVLVITGKGREVADEGPIPVRTGALRHQVPDWLASGPAAQAVLQVAPAHRKHGGDGAYYVYLRRR